jgi:VanZ family protein
LNYPIKIKKRIIYQSLIFFWTVLLILTSIPGKDMPDLRINDKVIHFTAFVVLGFLLFTSLKIQDKSFRIKKYSFLFAFIILVVYAFIDEQHQRLIPGRSCDTADMIADIAGGFLGILAARLLFRMVKNRLLFLKKELP